MRRGSWFVQLAERRPSIVRFLLALLAFRIVVTVTEIFEQRVIWWSVLITVGLALETWRAWAVSRAGRRGGEHPAPLPPSGWDKVLLPLERFGTPVTWALTVAYAAGYVVLVAQDTSKDTLIDIAAIVREVQLLMLVLVLLAARGSLKAAQEPSVAG